MPERYKNALINHPVYFNNLTYCLQDYFKFQKKLIVFESILKY